MRLFREGHELEDLRAAAAIDLGYLADEVVELGDASGDADYGEAVASYERARDALDAARGPQDFVAICRGIWSGRRAMARVRARPQLQTPPNPDQPCFFDPGHGIGDQLVAWTPEGLDPRTVPACAADAARIEAGEQPDPRKLVVGDEAVAFWRAPGHFAFWFQGYFGTGEGCLPVRMLQGFPLARRFAEPAADVLARPRS